MEGPDPELQEEANKKESSWEVIREWFRVQKSLPAGANFSTTSNNNYSNGSLPPKRQDLKLLLGVLGCPLAPIPQVNDPVHDHLLRIKDIPFVRPLNILFLFLCQCISYICASTEDLYMVYMQESSSAHYIIQQYLAATGCLKQQKCSKNMYASGIVKMICCETEVSTGRNVKSLGTRSGTENGCFVLWQMVPGMWSLELVVAGNKVVAGSDGKTVWRHTPWLGTHAAKGPQRPLRRIIQVILHRPAYMLFNFLIIFL